MEPENLASQEIWDKGYEKYKLSSMSENYPIVIKIKEHIPENQNGSLFEIGCFPGRFLEYFGRLGYTIHGVDQTPYLKNIKGWLVDKKIKVGDLIEGDLFKLKLEPKYDVVFSSGFVEHFPEYVKVVKLHANFAKQGGYIVITAPNFRGFIQRALHYLLDKKNYVIHHIPAMNPQDWANALKEEGCEIIEAGYFGGFDFWTGSEKNVIQKIVAKIISLVCPIRWLPNSKHYSPEIIVIAKKNGNRI